ncbi:hypothetical protein B1A87_013185 [Arthrobacter sp. KBS0703]|uniref:DUF6994 family protein n=1 Tax=Arthrobacter sp. KBS0703 TaxID=1955698 RepID=UPI00098E9805|nr:hypothetical protein [Arthrobacter sp. KBS0703]TSE16657.1 hypothetical protein B1A87_013185 [Arthrobacter sp. KBS0703]
MTFDFHSDTPAGKDPDSFSPALRKYHQLLWSKELPSGQHFHLAMEPRRYLVHRSLSGVFFLASDTITTRLRKKARNVIRDIPEGDLPEYLGYTPGSALVFPGNRIGRKPTINGARGLHPRIADRFDLTLECIRRHYLGEQSPLSAVLLRYADFFALFGDFAGYVRFFLLEDLVEDDGRTIRFFHPFADFSTPAVPKGRDEYLGYLRLSNAFISARNRRIDEELQGRIAR